MTSPKTITALALITLLGMTACNGEAEPDTAPAEAGPDQQAPMPQQQMDPEQMALMAEAQELQQRLAPIQEEAMQDDALSSQLEDLQEQVEAAMREEDPELLDRMGELEAEFMAAQQSGDQARLQEIGTEAQGLQMEIQALQEAVLSRPEIREPIDAFEEAQRERMIEIDPEAGELLDRIQEIFEALRTP